MPFHNLKSHFAFAQIDFDNKLCYNLKLQLPTALLLFLVEFFVQNKLIFLNSAGWALL